MPQPGKAVGHMLPRIAPSSTSQSSDESGAIVSPFAKRYRPVKYAAHERMRLILMDALLLRSGAAIVCEQFLGAHRPLSVAPHKLAEQYRASGDTLDLDDAIVAGAAASR